MKLSVSNIAWPAGVDDQALSMLRSAGVNTLEFAPTRLWPDWVGATPAAAVEFRRQLADCGFRISSLQAILFARAEYKLLGSDEQRQLLSDHLMLCADLAVGVGAVPLVFGAPRNRELCGRSPAEAFEIAREFFIAIAAEFQQRGVCLCLEANPAQYGCEFIRNSAEAARLVRAVDSPGFRLHLDTGCMQLAGEDPVAVIREHAAILRHFHLSEPFLGTFEAPATNIRQVFDALDAAGYAHWVALEMRAADPPLPALEQAVRVMVESCPQAEPIR